MAALCGRIGRIVAKAGSALLDDYFTILINLNAVLADCTTVEHCIA